MPGKVDQSGFQLNKDELLKDVPFALKGFAGAFIDAINKMDANHDGKSDIAELAPFVIEALPVVQELLPLINNEKLKKWFVEHDWVKDAKAAEAVLAKLGVLADKVAKLAK